MSKKNQTDLNKLPNWKFIFKILKRYAYQKPLPSVSQIALDYKKDPFAILLSTLISLKTKDAITLKVSQSMLEDHPKPKDYTALPLAEIEQMFYPAAFYRNKASSLQKICKILVENYGEEIPSDQEKLMSLPGVGLKTANLVLSLAFDKPYICVDTHVHRICNRTGWVKSKTAEETTIQLEKILPMKNRIEINELLVLWGQEVCTAISPYCSKCNLISHCEQINVTKHR